MEISLNAVPNKVSNSLRYNKENSDGSMDVIPTRHPKGKSLQMNKVGKYIYEKCDGSNSVLNIVESIMRDFNNVSFDVIITDLFDILFSYWRLGFIDWELNPYDSFYNHTYKDYQYKILVEDEVSAILNEIADPNYDFTYSKKYALSETRIKQSIYLDLEQYFCVFENNTLKCLVCIKSENKQKTSADLVVLYLVDDYQNNIEDVHNFITWSKERFSKLLSKDIIRLNAYLHESNHIANVLDLLGFEKIGELKDSILINGEISSITVKSLKL